MVEISQYLIVKGKKRSLYSPYRSYTTRVTKSNPALDSDEIAVKIVIDIPEALFDKPSLEARVTIPEEAVSKPVITAEVIDNVEQIIKQNTGFEVKLIAIEPVKED